MKVLSSSVSVLVQVQPLGQHLGSTKGLPSLVTVLDLNPSLQTQENLSPTEEGFLSKLASSQDKQSVASGPTHVLHVEWHSPLQLWSGPVER